MFSAQYLARRILIIDLDVGKRSVCLPTFFFVDNVLELNGEGQLQIYPNPTSNVLNVKLPENLLGEYNYTIVDIAGKQIGQGIINSELSSIDVNSYTAGKYILTLRNADSVITGHFILK